MNAATTSSTAVSRNLESLDGTERAHGLHRGVGNGHPRESLKLALEASPNPGQVLCWPHAILELGGTFGVVFGGLSDAATGQLGARWLSARHPPRPLDAR